MDLVHEMTYHAMLRPPLAIGAGPTGTRMVFDVIGGVFEGTHLRGKWVGAGADWLLVGPDGFARLDVRGQIETDDGAFIYLQYDGLIQMNEKVQAAMGSASATEFRYGKSPADFYLNRRTLFLAITLIALNKVRRRT